MDSVDKALKQIPFFMSEVQPKLIKRTDLNIPENICFQLENILSSKDVSFTFEKLKNWDMKV
jgi:hypothetical protein